MTAVLLAPAPKPETPARSLVIATRVPPPPRQHTGDLWTTAGDITADCQTDGCGYHVSGERAHVRLALQEHHQMFHSQSIGVVLLNQPRQ